MSTSRRVAIAAGLAVLAPFGVLTAAHAAGHHEIAGPTRHASGWVVSPAVPDVPAEYGRSICAQLAAGASVGDVAAGLESLGGFSRLEADALIRQARPQYCP